MLRLALALNAFALLCCVPKVTAIPDPTVPHQVAAEAVVEIWVRLPDGKWAKVPYRLLEGWWIAGPPVVEPHLHQPLRGSS